MIGIVSHEQDVHTRDVRRRLAELGADVLLIDTAALPTGASLTADLAAGRPWAADWDDGSAHPAGDLRVMWWRRPQPFVLHPQVRDPQDQAFARGECAAAVAGLWSCLDAVWINDPDRDEAASRKMWQLKVASGLGLRIPATCMTNDPQRAGEFVRAQPAGAIFKSFSATPETWRETRPVTATELAHLASVRLAPVIFQEFIPGGVDVRVTVVGDRLFAAEIRAGEAGFEYDFRIAPDPPTSPHTLPAHVEEGLRALMRRLGLVYGAVDLRLAPDGGYVFLEVNPAGQWLFVEYATGLPITAALAGLMASLDRDAAGA